MLKTTLDSGTDAIDLTGNEFGQFIQGNSGSNVIDGGGGVDTLLGGTGNDTFVFRTGDSSGDTIVELRKRSLHGFPFSGRSQPPV